MIILAMAMKGLIGSGRSSTKRRQPHRRCQRRRRRYPLPRKKRNPTAVLPTAMPDNSPGPYRKEIEVLAPVRAYNEAAQERFVDNMYSGVRLVRESQGLLPA